MNANLRPMNLGEILDRTIQIYRARFLVFAGIAAVAALSVSGVYVAANLWLLRHPFHAPNLLFRMTLPWLIWAVSLYAAGAFLHLLARPAFVRTVSSSIVNRQLSVRDALAAIGCRIRTMLALNLFEQLVFILGPGGFFIAGVVGIGIMADSSRGKTPALFGEFLLLLALIIVLSALYLFLASSLALSYPCAVLENISWFVAVRRSWWLSRGSRGRIIAVWMLLFSTSLFVNHTLRFCVHILLHKLPHIWTTWHGFPLYLCWYSLATAWAAALIGPIYPIALTLFYYDQRIRHEGYDIERMMDAAGLNAPANSASGEASHVPAGAVEDQP